MEDGGEAETGAAVGAGTWIDKGRATTSTVLTRRDPLGVGVAFPEPIIGGFPRQPAWVERLM